MPRNLSETNEFKSGGYEPGDSKMDSPSGTGVVSKSVKEIDGFGDYDSEMSDMGKEWPRKHNDTAAMCDVDEDGVEHEPQGTHESTHAEADDGIQDKVSHNWPDKPKNDGTSSTEFGGSRWSDGGELHESWTPESIGQTIGGGHDLQTLFDAYARTCQNACLEDFQNLCEAHGVDAALDESSIMNLMDSNAEFVFYEGSDGDGLYWTPVPIAECDDACMRQDRRTKSKKKESVKALETFIHTAKNIVEGRGSAVDLNQAWDKHVGKADIALISESTAQVLNTLSAKFPGFQPLVEDGIGTSAIDSPTGMAIGKSKGDGITPTIPEQPTKFKELGDKNLLGKKQKNNLEGTPTIPGTAKGMAESTFRANIAALGRHVRKLIGEASGSLNGKYNLEFNLQITEGNVVRPTKTRTSLAEALVDAEEALQFHNPEDVTLVSHFKGIGGQIMLKQDVPLITINDRGPLTAEGRTLFRFKRNAVLFAESMADNSVVSRVQEHNWGYAVASKASTALAESVFRKVILRK